MGRHGSLPCSQDPATDAHPKLDTSCSHLPTLFS